MSIGTREQQPDTKPAPASGGLPALSEHGFLRYCSFTALYVAQGLPFGLLHIAVPAWMAERGLGTAEIGTYLAIIFLPWSLKLINGPIMDRFTYLPMGRRRPWILTSQVGLLVSFVGFAFVPDPMQSLYLMAAMGFTVNFFAAFQDVGVDGLAIDVLPAEQQPRANSFMWGGKQIGISGAAAGGGYLLTQYGFDTSIIALAILLAVIVMFPLLFRERPGERMLPWTSGCASEISKKMQLANWETIIRSLFKVFLLPASLFTMSAVFVFNMGVGMTSALLPVVLIQELSWTQLNFDAIMALAGLVAGVAGMIFGATVVHYLGRVRSMVFGIVIMIALTGAMGFLQAYWAQAITVNVFVIVHYILRVIITIAFFATAMVLCWKRVAATQFGMYMALSNLGDATGSALTGPLNKFLEYHHIFFAMSLTGIIMLGLLAFIDLDKHQSSIDAFEQSEGE